MHYNQNTKTISLAPASVNQSGTATLIVDTLGFANAQFVVLPQTASATTRVVALSIAEGDTTAAFTNVTGYVGGTNAADGFTLPAEMACPTPPAPHRSSGRSATCRARPPRLTRSTRRSHRRAPAALTAPEAPRSAWS
jgi:hypothetical protein